MDSFDPPDDNVLLAGLSDDQAQRQPATIGYFDYLNRFAAFEATLRANGQWFFPHPWLMTFIGQGSACKAQKATTSAPAGRWSW